MDCLKPIYSAVEISTRNFDVSEFNNMSWLLQKVIHNEAMKEDPKEIYGWRVFMLACSVRVILPIKMPS